MTSPPAFNSARSINYTSLQRLLDNQVRYACSIRSDTIPISISKQFDATFVRFFSSLGSAVGVQGLQKTLETGRLSHYIATRIGLVFFFSFALLVLFAGVFLVGTFVVRAYQKGLAYREATYAPESDEKKASSFARASSGERNAAASHSKTSHSSRFTFFCVPRKWSDLLCSPVMRSWWTIGFSLCISALLLIVCLICMAYVAYFNQEQWKLQCHTWAVFQGYFFGAQHVRVPASSVPTDWRGSYHQLGLLEGLQATITFPTLEAPVPTVPSAVSTVSPSFDAVSQSIISSFASTSLPVAKGQPQSRAQLCPICSTVYDKFFGAGGLKEFMESHKQMQPDLYSTILITTALNNMLSKLRIPTDSRDAVTFMFPTPPALLSGNVTVAFLSSYAQKITSVTDETIHLFSENLKRLLSPEFPVFVEAQRALAQGRQSLLDVNDVIYRAVVKWGNVSRHLASSLVVLVTTTFMCAFLGVTIAVGSLAIGFLVVKKRAEPQQLLRWIFIIFLTLVVFTGAAFVMSAVMFFVATVASDACAFSDTTLFNEGNWTSLPQRFWNHTLSSTTDMTVVLDTCLKRQGDGDIGSSLGLRMSLSQVQKLFNLEKERIFSELNARLGLESRTADIAVLSDFLNTAPDVTVLPPPLVTAVNQTLVYVETDILNPRYLPNKLNYISLRDSVPDDTLFLAMLNLFGQKNVTAKDIFLLSPQTLVVEPIGLLAALKVLNDFARSVPAADILSFCTVYLREKEVCGQDLSDERVIMLNLLRDPSGGRAGNPTSPPATTLYERGFHNKLLSNPRYQRLITHHSGNETARLTILRLSYQLACTDYILRHPIPDTVVLETGTPFALLPAVDYFLKHHDLYPPKTSSGGWKPNITARNVTAVDAERFIRRFFPRLTCTVAPTPSADGSAPNQCRMAHIIDVWAETMKTTRLRVQSNFTDLQRRVSGFVEETVHVLGATLTEAHGMLDNFNCQFFGAALDTQLREAGCYAVMPHIAALAFFFLLLAIAGVIGTLLAAAAYCIMAGGTHLFTNKSPEDDDGDSRAPSLKKDAHPLPRPPGDTHLRETEEPDRARVSHAHAAAADDKGLLELAPPPPVTANQA